MGEISAYGEAQAEIHALRERVRELEGFDEAHGRAINEIVMLAHWAKQYHNGAHDCDCGWCRACKFFLSEPAPESRSALLKATRP